MSRPDKERRWGLHNSRTERNRRAAVVAAHIEMYGPNCPGYGVAGHPSDDLTADHVTPVAAGGTEDGPLVVLCRACNSRKRDGRKANAQGQCQFVRSRNWICGLPNEVACCPREGGVGFAS